PGTGSAARAQHASAPDTRGAGGIDPAERGPWTKATVSMISFHGAAADLWIPGAAQTVSKSSPAAFAGVEDPRGTRSRRWTVRRRRLRIPGRVRERRGQKTRRRGVRGRMARPALAPRYPTPARLVFSRSGRGARS